MSKLPTSFAANVSKLITGSVLAQGLGVLVAPIVARLFAPEAFGVAALFASITGTIGVVACLRYELSIMLPKSDEEAANLFGLSLFFVLIITGISALIIFFAGDLIVDLLLRLPKFDPSKAGYNTFVACIVNRKVSNLLRQAKRHGVEIRCGETLDRDRIEKDGVDHVILATGGKPYQPELEIDVEARVYQSWDVISDKVDLGPSVLIADSRCAWIGLGLAEKLARDGFRVTLAVTSTVPGEAIQQYLRDQWNAVLHTLNVEVINYARLYGADGDSAYLQQTVSGEAIVLEDIDSVVLAQGNCPHTHLEQELQDWHGNLYLAGDCAAPRSVEEAVLEGLMCANSIGSKRL